MPLGIALIVASVTLGDPGQLTARLDEVEKAREKGDLGTALKLANQAEGLAREPSAATSAERQELAVTLAEIKGTIAQRSGDGETARKAAEYAYRAARARLPEGNRARIRAQLFLAENCFARKDLTEARRLLAEANQEAGRNPRLSRILLVETRIRQAQLLTLLKEPADAATRDAYIAAGSLSPDHPSALLAEDLLGAAVLDPMIIEADESSRATGDGEERAEEKLRAALRELREALRRAGVPEARAALGELWLARFFWRRQDLTRTEAALDELARAGGSDAGAAGPAVAAEYWSMRGLVESRSGQLARARDSHERAIAEARKLGQIRLARCLNNLGEHLLRQGDYLAAKPHFREAMALYGVKLDAAGRLSGGGQTPDLAWCYAASNLGKVLEQEGDIAGAERLYRAAIEAAARPQGQDRFALCLARNNLGMNRYLASDLEAAEREWVETRRVVDEEFGKASLHAAEVEVNLAWIKVGRGDHAGAARQFAEALRVMRAVAVDEHPRIAEVEAYLARAEANLGDKEKAKNTLVAALDRRERYLAAVLRTAASERDQLALVQNLRVHFESSDWPGVFDSFLELAPALGIEIQEQYRRLLVWKGAVARARVPLTAEQRRRPEVAPLLARREVAIGKLRAIHFAPPKWRSKPLPGATARELEEEIEAIDRRLGAMTHANPPGPDGQQDDVPSRHDELEKVLNCLGETEVLIDVIRTRRLRNPDATQPTAKRSAVDTYVAFVVRPGRPIARIDLGETTPLNAAITAFHEALRTRRGTEFNRSELAERGTRVAELFQRPLLTQIAGAQTLVLAGDDLLNRMPLAALPAPDGTGYWAKELAFASIASAQSLVARREWARFTRARGAAASKGLIAVGDIDYGDESREPSRDEADARSIQHVEALPATRAEVESVRARFRARYPDEPAEFLGGDGATEEAFLAILPKRRFAHVATHGFYFGDFDSHGAYQATGLAKQFDSALVMARFNLARKGDARDQLITSEELREQDLRGVALFVLSACDTGLGHIQAGQGMVGLVGALDRAGVGTVVGGLWKVADEPTMLIMDRMYAELWDERKTVSVAEALRRSQQAAIEGKLIRKNGKPIDDPRFWAPFVVSGAPELVGSAGP